MTMKLRRTLKALGGIRDTTIMTTGLDRTLKTRIYR